MAQVRQVPRGTMQIPLPPTVQGDQGPRNPGGWPPVAWRSATVRWVHGNRTAPEPFCARAVRREIVSTRAAWA